MYKTVNLEIVYSTLAKFGLKEFQNAVIEFCDINKITVVGHLTSTEIYALSAMTSKFLLEKDSTLEPFKI